MTPTSQASATILDVLEARIQLLLPPIYQQTYKDVSPRSMGSAALRYGADGRVRWNEIWGSFCDLAMAGGPPHRGTLLEPASVQEIALVAAQYNEVVSEVCRGLRLVTGLHVYPAQVPGWVSIDCTSVAMAAWLARAIVMENVAARARGLVLEVPAAPAYRLEKEIKNVITSVAKCMHYWSEHMSYEQQGRVGDLLRTMQDEMPLVEPSYAESHGDEQQKLLSVRVAENILQRTGLRSSLRHCARWLSVGCDDASLAISMMRLLAVRNVVVHCEGTLLYVPLNTSVDPSGTMTAALITSTYQMAR